MTDKQLQEKAKIYIASKTKHAEKWRTLRSYGFNIISTWIDSLYPEDLEELCKRCIRESLECDAMIVYSEPGDYLKGAFIEMGVALSNKRTMIFLVGDPLQSGSVFTHDQNVYKAKSVEHALDIIQRDCIAGHSSAMGEAEKQIIDLKAQRDVLYSEIEELRKENEELKAYNSQMSEAISQFVRPLL